MSETFKLSYTGEEINAKLGATPDWNETNPSSPNYIKNKTHGIGQKLKNPNFSGMVKSGNHVSFDPFTSPRIIYVEFNGRVYECSVVQPVVPVAVGNIQYLIDNYPNHWMVSMLTPDSYTGEEHNVPFVLAGEFDQGYMDIIFLPGYNEEEQYIAFSTTNEIEYSGIQPLDEKYIPNTIARAGLMNKHAWLKETDVEIPQAIYTAVTNTINIVDGSQSSVVITYTFEGIDNQTCQMMNPQSFTLTYQTDASYPGYFITATTAPSYFSTDLTEAKQIVETLNTAAIVFDLYISFDGGNTIYAAKSNSSFYGGGTVSLAQLQIQANSGVFLVSEGTVTSATGEIVYSSARDAYTDGEKIDGVKHTYLGLYADKAWELNNFNRHAWLKNEYITTTGITGSTNVTTTVSIIPQYSLSSKTTTTIKYAQYINGNGTLPDDHYYLNLAIDNNGGSPYAYKLAETNDEYMAGETAVSIDALFNEVLQVSDLCIQVDDGPIYVITKTTASEIFKVGTNGVSTTNLLYLQAEPPSSNSIYQINVDEIRTRQSTTVYSDSKHAYEYNDAYSYIGIPSQNFVGTKIEVGSYIGTGEKEHTINFNFTPQIWSVVAVCDFVDIASNGIPIYRSVNMGSSRIWHPYIINFNSIYTHPTEDNYCYYCHNNSVTLFNDDLYNLVGTTYYYIAIG